MKSSILILNKWRGEMMDDMKFSKKKSKPAKDISFQDFSFDELLGE